MNHGEISMRCEVWILYDGIPDILILINTIMTYHIIIHNDTITFLLDSVYSHIEYTYHNIIITPNISIRSSLYVNIVYFSFSSPNAPKILHWISLIPLHHHRWKIRHPERSQEVVFFASLHSWGFWFGSKVCLGRSSEGPRMALSDSPCIQSNLYPFHQLWIALEWGRMNCEYYYRVKLDMSWYISKT